MNADWPRPPLYSVSFCAIKNGRRRMEDRHVILHDLNVVCGLQEGPQHSYYAVFDGHAGIEAASYAAAHLHLNLVQHPDFYTDTEKAIKEAFRTTDQQFLERSGKEGIKSGCTVVCCLIRERTLYLAWLGDSQAILVRQGEPLGIVSPHKPDREDERTRIENDGGCVLYVGTWRVSGTLAVSRALGDFEHKPYISCEPDIKTLSLDGTEDFLVLACDGLWDKLSLYDVAALVYSYVKENPDNADAVASQLVHQAKEKGSNDNITVVVTFLREPHNLAAPTFPSEVFSVSQSSFINTCNGKGNHEGLSYSVDIHEKRKCEHKPMHIVNGTNGFEENGTLSDRLGSSHTCDSDLTMEIGVDVPLPEQAEKHKPGSWNENTRLPDKEDVALSADDAFEKHEYEPAENLKSKDATLLSYQFSHQTTLDLVPCTVVVGQESTSVKIDDTLSSDLTSNNELDLSIDSFTGQDNSEGNILNSCKKAILSKSSLHLSSSEISEVENDRNRKIQTVQALKNVRNFDVDSKDDDFPVENMSHSTSVLNENAGELREIFDNVKDNEVEALSVSNLADEIFNEFKVVHVSAQEIQASSTDSVNCLKGGDQQVPCADREFIVENLCHNVLDASQKTVLPNTTKPGSNDTSLFASCETTKGKELSENENILEFQSSMVTSEQEKLLEKSTGLSGIFAEDAIPNVEQESVGIYPILIESEMIDKRKESTNVFSLSEDTHEKLDTLEDIAGHLGLNTETYEQLDKTKDYFNEPISSAQEVEKSDELQVLNNKFILTTEIDEKLSEPKISVDVPSFFAEAVQKQEEPVDEYCLTISIDEKLGKLQESVEEPSVITEAMKKVDVSKKSVNETFNTTETAKLDELKQSVNDSSLSKETVEKLHELKGSDDDRNLSIETVEKLYEPKESDGELEELAEGSSLTLETLKMLDKPKESINELVETLDKQKESVNNPSASTETDDKLDRCNQSIYNSNLLTKTVENVYELKESVEEPNLLTETVKMLDESKRPFNETFITTENDEKLGKPKKFVDEPSLSTEIVENLEKLKESYNEPSLLMDTVEKLDKPKESVEEPSLTTETMNIFGEPEESTNETTITRQTVEKLDEPNESIEECSLTTETVNMLGEPEESTNETLITTQTIEKLDKPKESIEECSLTTETVNMLGEPEESTNETLITTQTIEKLDKPKESIEECSLTTETVNMLGEPEESTNETLITTQTIEKLDKPKELIEEQSLTTGTMNMLDEPEESTNETIITTQTIEKLDKPKESVEEHGLTTETVHMLGEPEESTNETVITTQIDEKLDKPKELDEEHGLTTETMNMLDEPEESTNETIITTQTVEKLDKPKEAIEEPSLTTGKMNMIDEPEDSTNETVITTETVEKLDKPKEAIEEPSLTTGKMNMIDEPEDSTNETIITTETVEKLDDLKDSGDVPNLSTEITKNLEESKESTDEPILFTEAPESPNMQNEFAEIPVKDTESIETCIYKEDKETEKETIVEGIQQNCEPCAENFMLHNIVKSDNEISDINNQASANATSLGEVLPSAEDSDFEKDSEWKYIQGDDKSDTQAIKHTKVSLKGSPSKASSIKSETSRNIKLSSTSKTKQNQQEGDKKERKPVAGKSLRNQHEKKELSSKVIKTVSKQTKSTSETSSLKKSPVTSSTNLKTGKPNNVTVRSSSKQVSAEAKTESTGKITTTSCTSLNKLSRPLSSKNTSVNQSTRTVSSAKVSSSSSPITQKLKSAKATDSTTTPKSGKEVSSQEVGSSSVKPEKSSSPPQVKVSSSHSSAKTSAKKDSSGVVGKKNETTVQNRSPKPALGTVKNLKPTLSSTKSLDKQKTEPSSGTAKNLKPTPSSTKSVDKQKTEPSSGTAKNLKPTPSSTKSVDKQKTEPSSGTAKNLKPTPSSTNQLINRRLNLLQAQQKISNQHQVAQNQMTN
ncbi:uncharacterized protein LOC106459176 isoform X3 [Limulus polyphemus]|nr:uncharacterized protein LOC106459176 isoform X3 [Limulus polyphemus]XP_013774229.1 uncharacterized protein LOC106459176 isoform X3 [Limulus polyphemus]XP_022241308.1 uncharacterized protein LOC106459176 isoform X3 [Limulus polyphemus]